MLALALIALVGCVAGWCLALGALARYLPGMAKLKALVSWKSFGAACYAAVPILVHAAFPKFSIEMVEAAELMIAVHLFHVDPKSLPKAGKDESQ